jgi:catechol 2,3-dioxygenase-like lactoylglutathione lyase family enzyme
MTKMKVQLDHLNLTVRNFKETAAWYGEIFGFEIVEEGFTEDSRPWGILRNSDSMLCVYENSALSDVSENGALSEEFYRIFHFGLKITDRGNWERLVTSKKLRIDYGGAVNYPHSTSWYIKDPSGHTIEVVLWNENIVKFD